MATKNKGGRPRNKVPRDKLFQVKLTQAELETLHKITEGAGTPQQWIRNLISSGDRAQGAADHWSKTGN